MKKLFFLKITFLQVIFLFVACNNDNSSQNFCSKNDFRSYTDYDLDCKPPCLKKLLIKEASDNTIASFDFVKDENNRLEATILKLYETKSSQQSAEYVLRYKYMNNELFSYSLSDNLSKELIFNCEGKVIGNTFRGEYGYKDIKTKVIHQANEENILTKIHLDSEKKEEFNSFFSMTANYNSGNFLHQVDYNFNDIKMRVNTLGSTNYYQLTNPFLFNPHALAPLIGILDSYNIDLDITDARIAYLSLLLISGKNIGDKMSFNLELGNDEPNFFSSGIKLIMEVKNMLKINNECYPVTMEFNEMGTPLLRRVNLVCEFQYDK